MKFLHGALAILLLVTAAAAFERPTLITVSTSEDHAIEGGSWRSILKRTAQPWNCGSKAEAATCVEHALVVDNQSPQSLACYAEFAYQTPDGVRVIDPETPALILPRSSHEIRGRITAEGTTLEVTHLDCAPRAPYKRLAVDPQCKYDMHGNPLEDYYPAAAMRLALEGPVTVSFVLPRKRGAATEVAVADSSLVPMLDTAAKRFIADQMFTTKCPGTRYDIRMRFRMRDRYTEFAGS
ncbi:MAG TPA: TonB family protein [Steroidobacteraceae bacterium]|nr:TonB family protein [Steroidobacteraceae bacterium]